MARRGRPLSKLLLFTVLDRELLDGGAELFELPDIPDLSDRSGDQVIIADTQPSPRQGYVALGILGDIKTGGPDAKAVYVSDIRLFPMPLPFDEQPTNSHGIEELNEERFSRIIADALGQGKFDENTGASNFSVSAYQFADQLGRQQNMRCSFSDVKTYNGVASMIRPLHLGGELHVSNFLFLDPEPGALFERFAWTVGPQFEIIVDTHAVSPDIADTVNRTGMLALNDSVDAWPDREALAWHREQFFARLNRVGSS